MRRLGFLTAISMLVAGAAAAGVAVKSVPDVRRYFKIRNM